MTRIVVLDGFALNPGDLSWAELESLGSCTIYDRSAPEETVPRAAGAEVVLTNKVGFSENIFGQLPDLRYVGVLATGYDIIDVRAAARRGIVVTNVPEYGTASVAQMVFAHLLNLTQRVAEHGRSVVEGRWTRCPDFCYWDYPLVELSGLTLGIVGFGRIGRATAAIGQALGMKILAHDATSPSVAAPGVRFVGLKELFRQSDAVSLHCPLTPQTRRMIDAERLGWMKPTAYLINTSRGALIDERALAEALDAGRLAGAGLDVLDNEPPSADHPLFHAKNCYITPHIAWATLAARRRLLDAAVANVKAFLAGRPQNAVAP